jgi:hypothetical protein
LRHRRAGTQARKGVRLAATSGRPESILRPSTQLNGMICSKERRSSTSMLSTLRRLPILAAAGYNFRRLIRWLRLLLCRILVAFMAKLQPAPA